MPDKEHRWMTAAAIALLPEWQQAIIAPERERLVNEYCKYPDWYFDVDGGGHAKAAPYHFATDGIQFHYLPDSSVVDKYRYWQIRDGELKRLGQGENLNWKHARNGFTFYFTQIVGNLRGKQWRDALAFAGCLLHVLQDACFTLHSLEGPYGTDVFVLDRLFDHGDQMGKLPSNILAAAMPEAAATRPDHVPARLGNSVDEAVCRLYGRYVRTCLEARKLSFRIVQNVYEGRRDDQLHERMFHNAVKLCADTLDTAFRLAAGEAADVENLPLTDLEPVDRFWGCPGPYRYVTMLRDKALSPRGEIVPLRLTLDGKPETFERGLSFGSHVEFCVAYELPRDVYRRLSCWIGLQAEFVDTGDVALQLLNDGREVFAAAFNQSRPAAQVEVDRPGGRLEIVGSSPAAARSKTVVAIAAPTLWGKQTSYVEVE